MTRTRSESADDRSSPSPPTRAAGPALFLAWAAIGALFLALSLKPVTNNDIWLHLTNGEWILEHGRVPLNDPYSFSAEGARFHAHEWLAGVVFHLVHRATGVVGLIVFKTAVLLAALGLIVAAARRARAAGVELAIATGLALIVFQVRFLVRPEVFTFLLTALYVLVLTIEFERTRTSTRGWRSLLWWLVPAQWFWVQVHGYFLTGLILVGTYLAAGTAARVLVERRRPPKSLVSGWAALIAMTLAGLANPNGIDIYLFPFRLAGGDNVFMRSVFEWVPTFTSESVVSRFVFIGFVAWLVLLAVSTLDVPSLLRRRAAWRAVAVTGLLVLLVIRIVLAADLDLPGAADRLSSGEGLTPAPPEESSQLPASAWLWSPAELAGTLSGEPGVHRFGAAVLSPLRVIGGWGDDTFTLLWVALLVWTAVRSGRSAAPGLAVLATVAGFVFLLSGPWAPGILAVTLVPALAVAARRGRLHGWQFAVILVFLVLAVRQNRNMANFVIVTLPVLATSLGRLRTALAASRDTVLGPREHTRAAAAVAALAVAGTVLATTWGWPFSPRETRTVGLGVGGRAPVQAVQFIRERGLSGQVFNTYTYGAYLIHELFPDTRVFMDSRNGVYGEELYELYRRSLTDERTAAEVFARYAFDYVVVDYEFFPARSDHPGLFRYLQRNRDDWVLVYFDDRSVVYVPNVPRHADLVARDGYRTLDPVGFVPGSLDGMSPAERARFDAESRRALERRPGDRSRRLLRAEALQHAGRVEDARALFGEVLERDPNDLYSLIAAARIDAAAGRVADARRLYDRVLGLRPGYAQVRAEMEALEASPR